MERGAIERERSIGEVVEAVDERVERRTRAQSLDRLGDALGVLDPHVPRVLVARVAVVSLVGRLTRTCLPCAMTPAPPPRTMRSMLQRRALAAVTLASLLGVVAQFLFFHQPLGLNALLLTVLFLAAAWTLRDGVLPFHRRDVWLPASAVAFAAFCAIRADVPLLTFDILAAFGLVTVTVVAWGGVSVTALPVTGLIREAWSLSERLILGAADVLFPAWPRLRIVPKRFAGASGYLGGVGLAVPFVVVFAVLFSSADAVFARSLENVFDLKRIAEFLGETPGRLFIALAVAWPAAGALAALYRVPRDHVL